MLIRAVVVSITLRLSLTAIPTADIIPDVTRETCGNNSQ
jgi:hypothetical protein